MVGASSSLAWSDGWRVLMVGMGSWLAVCAPSAVRRALENALKYAPPAPSALRMALENALKYGLRSGGRMVSFLTFGNPNIPLAL
eukprot:354506-Chlamydomonas_euryale.AAC.2